jgi:glutathione S-transferase
MTYKLYYSPGACSMAIHAILNELNQPVELIKTDIQNKSAEFLKINPRGAVPVVVTPQGQIIREGGAQIVWLCDTHQSSLLPTSGTERATALEWLMMANSTLHPAYGTFFMLSKLNASDELKAAANKKIQKLWDEIEERLTSTGAFICGTTITAADILLTVIANWNGWLMTPITFGPSTQRMLKAVSSRPAFMKAMAAEQVEYKAAA